MNTQTLASTPSRTARLATFFRARPGIWIDGLDLGFSGQYAWRSRISDLRRSPWQMNVINRQRRIKRSDGSVIIISEYKFIPGEITTAEEERQGTCQRALPLL